MSAAIEYTDIEVVKMLMSAAMFDAWDEVRDAAHQAAACSPEVLVWVFELLLVFLAGHMNNAADVAGLDRQTYLQFVFERAETILVLPGDN